MKKMKMMLVLSFGISLFATAFVETGAQTKKKVEKPRVQTARILINGLGYSRTSISLRRGVPARLTFLRQTNETCATEIVIPAYGINRSLPLNEPVVIRFTPTRTGGYGFTCGMNMMRGKLIVR